METQYTVRTTKDGKMMFTKDVEIVTKEHDELVIAITEHTEYDAEDAEIYAQWLKNTCLDAYRLEYELRRKIH